MVAHRNATLCSAQANPSPPCPLAFSFSHPHRPLLARLPFIDPPSHPPRLLAFQPPRAFAPSPPRPL
eukprot:3680630-Pleurochrysis_carterae.AAC.1